MSVSIIRIIITIIAISCLACHSNIYADTTSSSNTIFLHTCNTPTQYQQLRNSNQPFYCTYVGGSALHNATEIYLDSGSNTVSIPLACLNPNAIKIIQTNTIDNFGNPADLVQGEISLDNYDASTKNYSTVATVKNLQFYALTGVTCAAGFKNFGANFTLYKNTHDSCVGNFFTFYDLPSQGHSQGYVITKEPNHTGKMILGTLPPNGAVYPFTLNKREKCGDQSNVPNFINTLIPNANSPYVPSFSIKINGIDVPSTDASQPATNKLAIIDTGGGLMAIADDNNQTIVKALNQSQTLVSPKFCPANTPWLQGCSCLQQNISVEVSSQSLHIDYKYYSSDIKTDQTAAVAICPASNSNSSLYVTPNSVNLGYQLFQYVDVGFDYGKGEIYFKQR